jgi:hypothetical protein
MFLKKNIIARCVQATTGSAIIEVISNELIVLSVWH